MKTFSDLAIYSDYLRSMNLLAQAALLDIFQVKPFDFEMKARFFGNHRSHDHQGYGLGYGYLWASHAEGNGGFQYNHGNGDYYSYCYDSEKTDQTGCGMFFYGLWNWSISHHRLTGKEAGQGSGKNAYYVWGREEVSGCGWGDYGR